MLLIPVFSICISGMDTLRCTLWNIQNFILEIFKDNLLSFNHVIIFSSSMLIMLAVSLLFVFMGAKIVVSSANNINLKKLLDLTISFI